MKPREKRTSTEPGLGKVAGETRKTSVRERERAPRAEPVIDPGDEIVDSRAPTDRPPSGPPISAPAPGRLGSATPPSARYTRALERPLIARDDGEQDGSTSRDAREEMPFDRLAQLERMERT